MTPTQGTADTPATAPGQFIDARSERLDADRRDRITAELTERVKEMTGLSGADVCDVFIGLLAAVESQLPPADALHFERRVATAVSTRQSALSDILLTSVDRVPGAYDGFTVSERTGSRKIDYDTLQAKYPKVYGEVVTEPDPNKKTYVVQTAGRSRK